MIRDAGVGRVGKDREIVLAIRGDAITERPDEFGIAPSADPVGGVGRNVGAGKDTEWRFQFATAGQQRALVFMVRMTAGATGGVKQVLSPFDIAVGKGRRRRNYQDGCGQTNQPALMKHGFRDYFFFSRKA